MEATEAIRKRALDWQDATIDSLGFLMAAASVAGDTGPTAMPQKLFDAMAAHDGAGAKALFTADANLVSVAPDGKVTATPIDKWTDRISSSKDAWLERMWSAKVQEDNAIATVWGEYDFHLNGKSTHCGIDTFTLVKTNGASQRSCLRARLQHVRKARWDRRNRSDPKSRERKSFRSYQQAGLVPSPRASHF